MPDHLPPTLVQWLAAHAHSWPFIIALLAAGIGLTELARIGERR